MMQQASRRHGSRALLFLGLVAACMQATQASYGVQKSIGECNAELNVKRDALLSGDEEPYAWKGPSKECDTEGCNHSYWGRHCRFEFQPSCPHELRKHLTSWLRHQSSEGAKWAEEALLLRPCDLWPYLKGRSVWVAGDSQSQETANTLVCFLIEYMQPDFESVDPRGTLPAYSEQLIEQLEEGSYNKRVAYWCKAFHEDTRICYLNADKGPRLTHLLRLMPQLATSKDILIMNLGIHYGEMGELREDIKAVAATVTETRSSLPDRTYWKETTPQHYNQTHGMMDGRIPLVEQTCHPPGEAHGVNITVFPDGSVGVQGSAYSHPLAGAHDMSLQKLLTGGHRNAATQPVIDKLGSVKTLPAWNLTLTLWEYHQHIHGKGNGGECEQIACDCTHTCNPSWGQMLLADFRNLLEEDADIEFKPRAAIQPTQQLELPSTDTEVQPIYMEATVAHRSSAGDGADEGNTRHHGPAAEQAAPGSPVVRSEVFAEQLSKPSVHSFEAPEDSASTLPVGPTKV